MELQYSTNFLESMADAPLQTRKAFYKQIRFLKENIRHPSLHAKKYDESKDIWQARVNKNWRFYFTIHGDVYYIHNIKPHPK